MISLKRLGISLLSALIRKRQLDGKSLKDLSVGSVLVIRQHDMLGDFLLSTPVFGALRNRFPKAKIGVLVRDYFAEVALHHPSIDEVVIYQKQKPWSLEHWLTLLRRLHRRWDLVIILNTVSHSLSSDLLAHLTGAKLILGPEHPPLGPKGGSCFYTIVAPHTGEREHQSHKNLDIVRAIGAETAQGSESMHLLEAERAAAAAKLEQRGLPQGAPAIGFHLGAGKLSNRWPVEGFLEVAERVEKAGIGRVIVYWGPKEEDILHAFRARATFSFIEIPPTNLRELAASFLRCTLLVCNDTGVMHLAAAADVPVVAIFGPTDPKSWKPIGDRFVAIRADDGKLSSVTADMVYAGIVAHLQWLAGRSTKPGHISVENSQRLMSHGDS